MKKKILLGLLGLLLLAQFVRPDLENPVSDPANDYMNFAKPPAEVQNLIKSACYDCHSNETVYPWYAQISPLSWWLRGHAKGGRHHLNFSEFGAYSADDRPKSMEEAAEEVSEMKMPLKSYTWLHPSARLTDAQRKVLADWFKQNSGKGNGEGGERVGGVLR